MKSSLKRKVRDDDSEMDVDAATTVEATDKAQDKDISEPKKKKRKPSIDVEVLLSDAVSSIPDLSPKEIAELKRNSSSNPYNTAKGIVKRCRHVESFQQCFSEDEKTSFAILKDITLPDMKELKVLTDMQRVALRYHMQALLKLETDYNFKKNEDGAGKEVQKVKSDKKKKEQKSLQFVGEHLSCPAIPKNRRRTIDMIVKRIDKRNKVDAVEDLKKKTQLELKQVLEAAAKLKKGQLTEALKDCKAWERLCIKFTLSTKLRDHLSSEQKFNKNELTYVRLHIFKANQMIGILAAGKKLVDAKVPTKKVKTTKKKSTKEEDVSGKETEKKTKVPPPKKVKENNKTTEKKEEVEEEEPSSEEEMSMDEAGKEFDDETQANSADSDDDNNE